MITFEDIIGEKEKSKRDALIKEKLFELNAACADIEIDTNSIMTGFISSNSKIQFSDFHFDLTMGLGSFYGMKEQNYFYEFFDFLTTHNITTKQDVIRYISSFLKLYFDEQGKKMIDREIMFDDIWKKLDAMYNDSERFKRCRDLWLDIGIFKNRSAAECTEHACITQNLLTFCDIDSCYISGHIKSKKFDEDHAYNIFKFNGEYYLLDSTNPYCLFDSNDNYVGCNSYFFKIEKEKINNFIQNHGEIKFSKFNYMKTPNGKAIKVDNDTYTYTTSSRFINDEEMNIFLDINQKNVK